MPLQIRRGTAAERTGLTTSLAIGELLYVTDQGKLYIGDGTSIGSADIAGNPAQGGKGLIITGFTSEEAQDATAVLFSNGTHTNISFSYNDGANALSAAVNLSSYIGNVTIDGIVEADFIGSIFAADSSVLVDAVDRKFFGDLEGNVVGSIVGDIKGSVFGDDSTLLVDATNSTIPASALVGTFTGNVIGNVIGNVSGNIETNLISSATSSTIVCDTPFDFQTNLKVEGTLEVNDGGVFQSIDPNGFPLSVSAAFENDLATTFVIRRSRGTLTSPVTLTNGDRLGSIQFNGFDGTAFSSAATIQARVVGAVSAGRVPTALRFLVTATDGTQNEALTINQNGNIFLYARSGPQAPLQVFSHHNDATASRIIFLRTRGNLLAQTPVINGDPLFDLQFVGGDGATNSQAAIIRAVTDGAVSAGIVPGKLNFLTADTTGTLATRVEIATTKTTFNNVPVIPTYADETAADTAIGGSGNRVNGMMYYDTALGKIRAVAGGSWTSLH